MALATCVAGAYTATQNSVALGQQEDGFRLRLSFAKEEIRSNSYGDSVIDAVYRGGNCFISGVFIEADPLMPKTTVGPFNPYALSNLNATSGLGFMGSAGRLDYALSTSLVLTAVAGLSAATNIATLTAAQTIIDQNLNQEVEFANKLRKIGLVFRCYPYLSTDVKWFSVA